MIRTIDNNVYALMISVSFNFLLFSSYAIVTYLLTKHRKKGHKDQISTLPYRSLRF